MHVCRRCRSCGGWRWTLAIASHTHTHTQALSELRGVEVDLDSVQTNIVLFRLPAGNAHKVFAAGVHSCMASLSSYLHGRMYGV